MSGSFINQIMPAAAELPKVGDGATLCFHSDRHAATVIEVSDTTIKVQEDHATRIDGLGMTDSGQKYVYAPNPQGTVWTFTKRSDGKFHELGKKKGKGVKLVLGERNHYHDFSF